VLPITPFAEGVPTLDDVDKQHGQAKIKHDEIQVYEIRNNQVVGKAKRNNSRKAPVRSTSTSEAALVSSADSPNHLPTLPIPDSHAQQPTPVSRSSLVMATRRRKRRRTT
jgi:hypothetical protein